MANVFCPNCGKGISEEATIECCLGCAHPFNVEKWREVKRQEDEQRRKKEAQRAEWENQGKCTKCGGSLGAERSGDANKFGYRSRWRNCTICGEKKWIS